MTTANALRPLAPATASGACVQSTYSPSHIRSSSLVAPPAVHLTLMAPSVVSVWLEEWQAAAVQALADITCSELLIAVVQMAWYRLSYNVPSLPTSGSSILFKFLFKFRQDVERDPSKVHFLFAFFAAVRALVICFFHP